MKLLAITLLIAVCCAFAQPYGGYNYGYNTDAVQLEQVQVLTFSRGKMTTGRRSSPVSQLNCVGGSAYGRSDLQPATVQCKNVGSDGFGNINWKCEADLDSSVRFGETTVSCEGYSNPDDPYILKGSCGLEYSLDYTEQGRQGAGYTTGGHGAYNSYNSHSSYDTSSHHSGFKWGNVIMMVIIGCIIYGIWSQVSGHQHHAATGAHGNPPPYPGGGLNGGQGGTYGNGYGPSAYGGYPDPTSCNPTFGTAYRAPTQNAWRPGFWSGMGTGGMLGYLFGRPRTYGGGTYVQPNHRAGWSTGGSFGGGSSHQTSSPRTATAFATTRRR